MEEVIEWIRSLLAENDFAQGGLLTVAASSGLYLLRSLPGRIWEGTKRLTSVSYSVRSSDPIYPHAARWAASLRKRWRVCDTLSTADSLTGFVSYRSKDETGVVELPGVGTHFIQVLGWPGTLHRSREEGSEDGRVVETLTFTVPFWCRRHLTKRLSDAAEGVGRLDDDPIGTYFGSSWDWQALRGTERRALSTVVSPEAHKIHADLSRFLESEEKYRSRGIPWRRGYLLHGPPGTGKTSLVAALGSELQISIYILSPSSIDSDGGLYSLFSKLPPKSILLIEDIDRGVWGDDKDDERKGPSMAALLNLLDGLSTRPRGSILVMTTNNRKSLDPALVRPGRIDVEVEMGYLTEAQAAGMAALYGIPVNASDWVGRAPAELQGHLLDRWENQ